MGEMHGATQAEGVEVEMRIAFVTDLEFPEDIRIRKEATALAGAGHEVYVCTPVSRERAGSTKSFRVVELNEAPSPASALAGNLRRMLKRLGVQIIHAQDTPVVLPCVIAAKSLRLPLIYDIHETWPELVKENVAVASSHEVLWSKALLAEELAGILNAMMIVTVVEESTGHYQLKYHRSHDLFRTVRNFETLEDFRTIIPNAEIANDTAFKVAYVGGVEGYIRGLDEVIRAASLMRGENVRFLIVGDGVELPHLKGLSHALRVNSLVHFFGRRSFVDAMGIAAASDVCLVPHRLCFSTEHTLPHKISQYMCMRKPVISTNLTPLRRLFKSAFFVWHPPTAEVLAQLVRTVKEDAGRRREIATKGYEIVRDQHRWENEERRLIQMYESI